MHNRLSVSLSGATRGAAISIRRSLAQPSANCPCERTNVFVRWPRPTPPQVNSKKELAEIYAQIVRLQRSLNAHHLDELATYVSALRQRVAESLR